MRPLRRAASASVVLATTALSVAAAAQTPAPAGGRPAADDATSSRSPRVQYPATKTVPQVDRYHSTEVADPYRWLEDLDGPETRAWIAAQNAVTGAYLAATPGRDAIRDRLTALWNYPRVSLPYREGGRLFFTKNTGLQKQSPYYTAAVPATAAAAHTAAERASLVLDPNEISKDGSTSLSLFVPDPTGAYVAYGLSEGGADWRTVHVKRLADGKDTEDVVRWIRYSSVSWTKDGRGFFYTRDPEPAAPNGTGLSGKSLAGASRDPQVFYLAAAQYLVDQKITSPAKLAIRGGSNGGLLVGAAMTQRPDLFAVALPAVGVMDMLRYQKFSAGVFWVPEYGSSDDPAQFAFLRKYSPLHNLTPGTCYPATLTTTADHDDRVVPGHSFKWAAALQTAQGCERPVLIRIEAQGSHGYRPLDKAIAEQADVWAFAARNLGMRVELPASPAAARRSPSAE